MQSTYLSLSNWPAGANLVNKDISNILNNAAITETLLCKEHKQPWPISVNNS